MGSLIGQPQIMGISIAVTSRTGNGSWWLVLRRLGTLKYMRRLVGLLVVIWLAIGVVAVGQRGYFGSSPQNCAGVATIAVTVVAGPLNYFGVNPKVKCRLPQPSG